MSKRLDLIGKKFYRLTAIKFSKIYKNRTYFIFKCDCGNELELIGYQVNFGSTKSCGCLQKEMGIRTKSYKAKGTIRLECNGNVIATRIYRCYSQRAKYIEDFKKIRLPYKDSYLIFTPEID